MSSFPRDTIHVISANLSLQPRGYWSGSNWSGCWLEPDWSGCWSESNWSECWLESNWSGCQLESDWSRCWLESDPFWCWFWSLIDLDSWIRIDDITRKTWDYSLGSKVSEFLNPKILQLLTFYHYCVEQCCCCESDLWALGDCSSNSRKVQDSIDVSSSAVAMPLARHLTLPLLSSKNTYPDNKLGIPNVFLKK